MFLVNTLHFMEIVDVLQRLTPKDAERFVKNAPPR